MKITHKELPPLPEDTQCQLEIIADIQRQLEILTKRAALLYEIMRQKRLDGTMPDTVTQNKLLKANEVAKMLGLDRDTIYKWARSGRIPCIKFRHRMRFRLSDIERWEKQQTVGKLEVAHE